MRTFQDAVRTVVSSIPAGSVMTYQEVARRAGNPRAYRAAASVMAKNRDPNVPCHRVIKSDGTPGGYNRGGEAAKRALLRNEGLTI